jgi:hypothetical protein
MKIPKLINERNTTMMRAPIDGAVQISKGRIGAFAIFASQKTKAQRLSIATIKRIYSYGFCQPAIGA